LATVAVSANFWPNCREEVSGEILTERAGDVKMIVAAADLALSVNEVAIRVIAFDRGRAEGAVYVTAAPEALDGAESVPQITLSQLIPETLQVTPLFCGSF
jgi:hypothetical protein